MLFPYQIGDAPLFSFLNGLNGDGVQLKIDSKWRFSQIQFTGRRGAHTTNPSSYALNELATFKIDGTLMARDSASAQWIQSAIRSISGRISVPLIVFRNEDALNYGECSDIDWLYADTIVTSMDSGYTYGSEDVGDWGHVALSLSIEGSLLSPFVRLPKWFWEYRSYQDRLQDPFAEVGPVTPNNTFYQPSKIEELRYEGHYTRWLNSDTLLDPDYWAMKYYQDSSGGIGAGFGDFGSVFYYANPHLWSALPASLYAFTNLQPYGSLQIDVRQSVGFFANDDYIESSSLDLVTLDTDLSNAGYGGLLNSDIIYTGGVTPYPGFIYRNGAILEDIRPRWVYTGEYPGILKNGATTINIQAILTTGKMAYLVDYGLIG